MEKLHCWEVKECDFGPGSEKPCIAVDFELANGFLKGVNGSHACFYIKGTTCFDDDEFMTVPEKLAKYCNICPVYRKIMNTHGVQANLFYFLKFLHDRLEKQDRLFELPMINEQLFL